MDKSRNCPTQTGDVLRRKRKGRKKVGKGCESK